MPPFRTYATATLLALAMSQTLEAQAQPQSAPPSLTLAQVVQYCEPELKASDEKTLEWLDRVAQSNHKNAGEFRAKAADLRALRYESNESTATFNLSWVNGINSRKRLRELTADWKDELENSMSRTRARDHLCVLAVREAQYEGKSMEGAVAALGFRRPGADEPLSKGGSAKVRNK